MSPDPKPRRQRCSLKCIATAQPYLGPIASIVEVATVEREHIQRLRRNFAIAEKIIVGVGIWYGIRPEPERTEGVEQFRLFDVGVDLVRVGEAMKRIEC